MSDEKRNRKFKYPEAGNLWYPRTVGIGTAEYRIYEVEAFDPGHTDYVGLADKNNRRLYVLIRDTDGERIHRSYADASLRHEIVHAYLYECGLAGSSLPSPGGWATNEEMVDWIAVKGPDLYRMWGEANCLPAKPK